eukprot:5360577-Alexandrium_andersonii.AAC.1
MFNSYQRSCAIVVACFRAAPQGQQLRDTNTFSACSALQALSEVYPLVVVPQGPLDACFWLKDGRVGVARPKRPPPLASPPRACARTHAPGQRGSSWASPRSNHRRGRQTRHRSTSAASICAPSLGRAVPSHHASLRSLLAARGAWVAAN